MYTLKIYSINESVYLTAKTIKEVNEISEPWIIAGYKISIEVVGENIATRVIEDTKLHKIL